MRGVAIPKWTYMTRVQKNNRLKQPCTTSSGHRERCHNPICHNPLEPIENGWRRTERLHCSDKCRQDASIIRRAAAALVPLGKERRGRFSSHDWKAKKNDYKKRSREIKQLDEIGECTVVFATLNTIDRDGDVLMPSAIGEQVVPGHGGT